MKRIWEPWDNSRGGKTVLEAVNIKISLASVRGVFAYHRFTILDPGRHLWILHTDTVVHSTTVLFPHI